MLVLITFTNNADSDEPVYPHSVDYGHRILEVHRSTTQTHGKCLHQEALHERYPYKPSVIFIVQTNTTRHNQGLHHLLSECYIKI